MYLDNLKHILWAVCDSPKVSVSRTSVSLSWRAASSSVKGALDALNGQSKWIWEILKWRYWSALWHFRIFGSVRASYSAWPEGICFLSNAIKGIANTFLKLFKQNFTWNDCARMVFFKSTVADRSIVFLHWHCSHGVQLMSKDHRTFKTMIYNNQYNNRYGTMFLQGFVPLPGFACRLSRLPERKAGPACSSVTKKAEADWERKTCAQCSRCFSTAIYDILWHHLSVLSKTVNKWVKGCIACRGRPAPQTTLFRHAFSGIACIAEWSIDPSMMGTVWLLSLALRCYSTLIQVFMQLISIHLPWRPSALKVRKEKNWTRIRAVIANWCKVDRKLNFKPRWRKVLQDSSSSEALFFIVWCVLTKDGRLRPHWPLAWEGPIQPRKHDQRWNIEIIER